MKKLSLVVLIEAAFFAAFALVLDLIPSIKLTPMISISAAMIPIFIIAYRWGFRASILSGFLWGVLQLVVGDIYFLNIFQFLIEYFIAFAFIGFAGLFYQVIQKQLLNNQKGKAGLWIVVATLTGSIARYVWHFIAGVIFWGSYAPEGMSPIIYSLMVNGGTMIGSAILCSFILILLTLTAPRLLLKKPIASTTTQHSLQK
ncbi:energy-coupled thiamine transporter ThiT [Bacillus sp. 03113]|uniref:energy-coupled thiamine transporter ThiT n=1 Tax=Bacillus sp. 03113 TaxID=2578211 RepID=UPI001142AD7F|nr:energy-coupled thiamine transporter ThiT [Bacillus sp. 03113]